MEKDVKVRIFDKNEKLKTEFSVRVTVTKIRRLHYTRFIFHEKVLFEPGESMEVLEFLD